MFNLRMPRLTFADVLSQILLQVLGFRKAMSVLVGENQQLSFVFFFAGGGRGGGGLQERIKRYSSYVKPICFLKVILYGAKIT